MKEHGVESGPEVPGRVLKSLLKKPGQTKAKGQKNRVVINEKLNEFFAADYIILIKEECCADYEEECDCCCQEHEMIRLGNCKECRAELSLHFAEDPRFAVDEVDETAYRDRAFDDEEDEEDEEAEDEEEEDVEEEEEEERETGRGVGEEVEKKDEEKRMPTSLRKLQHQQHQQRETLSPPEGYKDLCLETEPTDDSEHRAQPVCAECDYYQRSASEAEAAHASGEENNEDAKNAKDTTTPRHLDDGNIQQTIDQAQQTTPDSHQRFLVETITMTTVTERRIVREISEEETRAAVDESSHETDRAALESPERKTDAAPTCPAQDSKQETPNMDENVDSTTKTIELPEKRSNSKETPDASELSLTLKLGNVSLITNSLKPNSAVRQLFPDPRFISPPPAPSKGSISCSSDPLDDDNVDSEAQKFLITTESLRLFDSVKRSKVAGSRSDSSESDSSSIKRTIERNALRRSLMSKFDTGSRKKNLRGKDLTLEERIRQLTCVDAEEDTVDGSSETSRTMEGADRELPARTSPSGEERPRSTSRTSSNQEQEANSQPSTYRKITDLFTQKKPTDLNLPDIGLGNKTGLGKDAKSSVLKMNSEARKQFLASLAPLSCVASTGVESREDYYRMSSKVALSGNRNSISHNSDSSYSLEDIEAALRGDERNYNCTGAPPDVTRGTPTSLDPDESDPLGDELLAFVEQDKSRTERIKRRYNDNESSGVNGETSEDKKVEDDDDDELNDYGFNKRPSVRGIKPQFSSTSDIMQQLRTRSIAANRSSLAASWHFCDSNAELTEKQTDGNTESTINRINDVQKQQIDDIYQSIAETTISVQGTLERGSYLESTLPRSIGHMSVGEGCPRYQEARNGVHYQDQHIAPNARMLRIAGGGDGVPAYGTLPTKNRRQPAYASNYHCNVFPAPNGKCYRTMYFVPYNGISDPTYQNLQRMLPSHSSPNYADHIERYPYPRNGRVQQQPRYYVRPSGPQLVHSQPPALHLHVHQSEEFHMSSPPNLAHSVHQIHPVHIQHHQQQQHHQQISGYNVQSIPSYSVIAPAKSGAPGYSYQVHVGRGSSDIQMQTISLPPNVGATCGPPLSTFAGTTQVLGNVSSSSSSSSVLSSPTKIQHRPQQQQQQPQRKETSTVAERGVPEGAASAPAHDFSQSSSGSTFLGHSANVPPPNTQNSVYYAMNV